MQVRILSSIAFDYDFHKPSLTPCLRIGSGCIAALEAEKFIVDLEDTPEAPPVTSSISQSATQEEQKTEENPPASLEYKSNPLL